MEKLKNLFLNALSFFINFLFCFELTITVSLVVDHSFHISSSAELAGMAVFLFYLIVSCVASIILGLFGWAISSGRFNSLNWKINRYWLSIGLPLLLFLLTSVISAWVL